ncbi:carboxypeptidase-like regulatory domain-containing protein [Clostridium botulinum]|uniref:carboxypeptidase-like regulatory domain-containing protein n=1 Tax=Clostridium botulinum TaxID=1491 RepID=UPI000AA7268C|nr:carboxypeptidase-like regulatory domain-containing protein [Clostridium botulinum]
MAQIMEDKYVLGQSADGTITTSDSEIRLDLTLQPKTIITSADINGIVTTKFVPVSSGYVETMTKNYVLVTQDKYSLGQSPNGTITTSDSEIRLDLTLQPNTNNITGANINGIVTIDSIPASGAYVKLMTENYNPVMHTMTNANGEYFLNNITQGNYYLFAIAQGMYLNQGSLLTLKNYLYYTIDFSLTTNSSASLAIIPGRVVDLTTNNPINEAVVSLYDTKNTLIARAYTNEYGQYVFREIPKGTYSITITATNYQPLTVAVSITKDGEIYPIQSTLKINGLIYNTIVVRGYDYRQILIIGFDVNNNTLTLQRNYPGTYFHGSRDLFFKITIYSSTGVEKLAVQVNGRDTSSSSKLNPIVGFKYEYGDRIKLWCSDPQGTINGALIITGTVIDGNENYSDGMSTQNMNNTEFEITLDGLKAVYLTGTH